MRMTKMSKYDAKADLEYRSCHLAAFLIMLGFGADKIQELSIDDVIERVRSRYAYSAEITHLGPEPATIAVTEFVKYLNILYSRNIRRAWFDVQVAMHEVENAK